MKIVEIVPHQRARLYATLVAKEEAIRKNGRGTYTRVGRKSGSSARWRHKAYSGSVQLKHDSSEIVTARIRASTPEDERQLLACFLGFVVRHSGDHVSVITFRFK